MSVSVSREADNPFPVCPERTAGCALGAQTSTYMCVNPGVGGAPIPLVLLPLRPGRQMCPPPTPVITSSAAYDWRQGGGLGLRFSEADRGCLITTHTEVRLGDFTPQSPAPEEKWENQCS